MRAHVNSTIRIHIDEESSDERYHQNLAGNTFVTYYTAIARLDNGLFSPKIVGNATRTKSRIVFESMCDKKTGSCVLDSSYPCIRDLDCGMTYAKALDPKSTAGFEGQVADVKIFLAWEGTVKQSIALRSSGLLPSKFRAYAMMSYLKQAVKVFIPDKDLAP
jgi:hypothetical protein